MKQPAKSQAVARNSLILGVMFGFNALTGLLSSVLLAQILDRDELGIYGTYFRAFSWMSTLLVFLIPPVLVRYVAELRGSGQNMQAWRLFRYSMKAQSILLAITALGFAAVYTVAEQAREISGGVIVALAASVFFYSFSQVGEGFLRGCQDFYRVAISVFFSSVARIVGLLALFLVGGTVASALGVFAIAQLVMCAMVLVYIVRFHAGVDVSQKGAPIQNLRKRIREYAATMGAGGIFSLIIWNYPEVFFLTWFWSGRSGLEAELAYYTLAISLIALPLRIGKVLSGALLPAFSELYGGGEVERLRKGYHQATVLSALVGVYMCLTGIALAEPLIRLLFPDDLLGTVLPFQLLLIPSAFLAVNHAGGAAMPAIEGHRFYLVSTMTLAPLAIVLNFLILPNHGAVGAATINMIVQSLVVISAIYYLSYRRRIGFPFRSVTKVVLAALISAIAAWFPAHAMPTPWGIIVAIPLGAGVYIVAVRLLKVLGEREFRTYQHLGGSLPKFLRPIYLSMLGYACGPAAQETFPQ